MKREQVARLVEHWRRPIPANELFRFSHILLNSKTDFTATALYSNSLGPHTVGEMGQPIVELGGSTEARPMDAEGTTLGWGEEYEAEKLSGFPSGRDEEYVAENPLGFPSSRQDINMHADEPEPDFRPEQVIDPDLIGLTHQIPPTVQMKKQPTKAKGQAGKKKSKQSAMRPPENDPIIQVEPPERTANANPRPKPRPLNPHLIVESVPAEQLSETGEPQPDVLAATHPDQPHPTAELEFQPPPQPMSTLVPVPVQAQLTPDIGTSRGSNPTVADESGRPRRQAPKRKLDPYLTWEIKEAEQKAEQERAKLLRVQNQKGVRGARKRQRTT
jgi:hypothetical protein